MGIVRGSFVIGAVATAAFLKIPAFAENPAEPPEAKQEAPQAGKAEEAAQQQPVAKLAAKEVAKLSAKEVIGSETEAKPAKPQPLFRHTSYPEAWTASQESNRPILLFVSMSGCHHCDKMMAESYHTPEMKKMISESFEPVYVTRKAHPKLVKSLKVRWYPTTVLVGPNNKVMDVIEGYVDTKTFRRRIQTGLAAGKTVAKTR